MLIENSTGEWDSPFIKMATIRFPRQVFNSPEHLQFSENLSFNPFHCLPEHRPLGGINRCRKIMYEALAAFRLERNIQELVQPQAAPDFLDEKNMKGSFH